MAQETWTAQETNPYPNHSQTVTFQHMSSMPGIMKCRCYSILSLFLSIVFSADVVGSVDRHTLA